MLIRFISFVIFSLVGSSALFAQDTTMPTRIIQYGARSASTTSSSPWVYAIGLAVFAAYIIALFIYFWYLAKKLTLLSREGQLEVDITRLPMGVPEGTVRSTIALTFIVMFVIWFFTSAFATGQPNVPSVLGEILMAIIGFYFGSSAAASASRAVVKPPYGMIRGQIEVEGAPDNSGVRVVIEELGNVTETDKDGFFTFKNVPPGKYTIVLEKEGYLPQRVENVVVTEGATINIGKVKLTAPSLGEDEL